MDGNIDIEQLAMTKYGIGQPVPRNEDPILVSGRGRYTDDLNLPEQAYAVIVRSRYAHGIINEIDTTEAASLPGVLGIYTGPDLAAAGIKPMPLGQAIPTRDGTAMRRPACPVLTSDHVRYVGDPVAIVVAETAAEAKDAAEAIVLDIEPLPAVSRASEAALLGAPQLHDDVPSNVAAEFHYGDAEKVAAAFATAAHVTRLVKKKRTLPDAVKPYLWKKGQTGNPGGTSAAYKETLRICRAASVDAALRLLELAEIEKDNHRSDGSLQPLSGNADRDMVRRASSAIMERAWGKPKDFDVNAEKPADKFDPRAYTPDQLDIIEAALRLMVNQPTQPKDEAEVIPPTANE